MAKPILAIFTLFIIGITCHAATKSNTLGPAKLSLFSKALHNIAASQCHDLLNKNELEDFQSFLNGRISKTEEATLAHPHHFKELLKNLTGCADYQQTISNLESEKKRSSIKNGAKFVAKFFKKSSQRISNGLKKLFNKIGHHFQGYSQPKTDASGIIDSTEIIKKLIDIASNSCPKSNFHVKRKYLTMIGKFIVLQVELGKDEGKKFSNLRQKITECVKLKV
ncbi:unnamed protein product [Orchesella dallaii]|uniref:Secreted protein n=1 Tax=Orchesella dallaii TaxID=48710 RepID=A0ABP1S3V7_9HEXA